MTLECTMSINGVRMYFLNGKHVSQDYARQYSKMKNINLAKCITISNRLIQIDKRKK